MKKAAAIPLLILVLFSGISINYSAHLCCGSVVSTKLSLKGEIASCGMEDQKTELGGIVSFKTHCCDNLIAGFQLKTNYLPSSVKTLEKISISNSVSFIPYPYPVAEELILINSFASSSPPGRNCFYSLTPETLHVFRI